MNKNKTLADRQLREAKKYFGGLEKINFSDENGVAAIKFLQKLVGITMTSQQALNGWHSMDQAMKAHTLHWYDAMQSQVAETQNGQN